jgi:hypothetical protein
MKAVLQLTSSEMVTIDMNLQMNVRVQVEKNAVIGNLSSCQVLLADPGPVKTWGCEVGPSHHFPPANHAWCPTVAMQSRPTEHHCRR